MKIKKGTRYEVQGARCRVQGRVTLHTLHLSPCTLHPVPCTLYPVPCTLYLAACTHSLLPQWIVRIAKFYFDYFVRFVAAFGVVEEFDIYIKIIHCVRCQYVGYIS